MRLHYGRRGRRRGVTLRPAEAGTFLMVKGVGLLLLLFAPLILTARHGHPTTVGWVLAVIEWAVVAGWWLGRGWRGRG